MEKYRPLWSLRIHHTHGASVFLPTYGTVFLHTNELLHVLVLGAHR